MGYRLEAGIQAWERESEGGIRVIKTQNMLLQAVLFVLTLGLYGFYWFYASGKSMVAQRDLDGDPALWTALLFIPPAAVYSFWKWSEAVESLSEGRLRAEVIFLMIALPGLSFIAWFVVQSELNRQVSR